MESRIPEKNKKAGVCYAVTDDGIELPIIDITHPAFAFHVSDAELNALIEGMVRSAQVPHAAIRAVAQKSILLRGIVESAGTYTTGMMTYLNKLETENLGDGYATPVDRQWAASLTPVTFRWRMRDVAQLLADSLAGLLPAHPGRPVHLVNIGGGPAMDSINALILTHKEHPDLLTGRSISIHVLDLDAEGPQFGARALAALCENEAPLNGSAIAFEPVQYNWTDTTVLRTMLEQLTAENGVIAGSSEGGLFEFASDEDIVANLQVLCTHTPADCVMVGPVVRDASTLDPRLRATEHVEGRPGIRYIGLDNFARLAARGGWTIARHLDGPMHQVVCLQKTASRA